jgi:hypothetical protein
MGQKTAMQLRSAARKGATAPDAYAHTGEDLAQWLQEVARRPWGSGPLSFDSSIPPEVGPQARGERRRRRHFSNGRNVVALAVLTIGYLQYYYLDVMVQIGSLQKLVVFVPLPTA